VITGRRSRSGAVVLLAVLGWLPVGGCARSVDGEASPGPVDAVPASAEQLETLIVSTVPSGRPRLPDAELHPPAGAKEVDDVASYAEDPARERDVLADYGYRFGWERFWGSGSGPVTGVFVDEFERREGAATYAEDLARNDTVHYRGMLHENPRGMPGGCRMLTVDHAEPDAGLSGPAAMGWCAHGVFSVSVTAVADSVEAAEAEVRSVMAQQIGRLPPR
jgi:hypothetical protein